MASEGFGCFSVFLKFQIFGLRVYAPTCMSVCVLYSYMYRKTNIHTRVCVYKKKLSLSLCVSCLWLDLGLFMATNTDKSICMYMCG